MKRKDGEKKHSSKDVARVSNGAIQQVGKVDRSRRVAVQVLGNSGFYSTAQSVALNLQMKIDHAMSMCPVRIIDPSTVPCPPLEGIELKRARARIFARKYLQRSSVLKSIYNKSKFYKLTDAECDAALEIVQRIKDFDAKKGSE